MMIHGGLPEQTKNRNMIMRIGGEDIFLKASGHVGSSGNLEGMGQGD